MAKASTPAAGDIVLNRDIALGEGRRHRGEVIGTMKDGTPTWAKLSKLEIKNIELNRGACDVRAPKKAEPAKDKELNDG